MTGSSQDCSTTSIHQRTATFHKPEKHTHRAMLVGTYDNFTDGDPEEFLRNLNAHMPTAERNKPVFIEKTGHTHQMKHQEVRMLF